MRNACIVIASAAACSSPAPARDFTVETPVTIAPHSETHNCFRVNVPEDIFVSKISTGTAVGVHHQILAVANDAQPEGLTECGLVLAETDSWMFLASSKPGEFAMPEGVAYPITGGTQLILQMHLYNAGDDTLDPTVSIALEGVDEAMVTQKAQLVAAGSLNIDLPPNQQTLVTGTCTLAADVQVFGILPHMHFNGTDFKAYIDNAGTQTVLFDDKFYGETQPFQRLDPTPMTKGSSLNIECDYFNATSSKVVYGQSAEQEMCYGYTYYYPAIEGQGPLCLK
jgi:hypothetical protein